MRGMKWPGSALVWISAVTLGILCLAGCRLDSGADRNDNSARWRQTAENGQRERQESTEGGGGENGMGERQAAAGEDGEQARTHELKPPSPGHLKPRFPEPGKLSIKLDRGFRGWERPGLSGDGSGGSVSCQGLPAGNGTLEILVPAEFVRDTLEISVLEYQDGSRILLRQGDVWASLEPESQVMSVGRGAGSGVPRAVPEKKFLKYGPEKRQGSLCLPLEAVCLAFDYKAYMEAGSLVVRLEDNSGGIRKKLPSAYDYRDTGRAARVRDQGEYGTCWSFASLTALETAMGPSAGLEFSADHMSLRNSFSLEQHQGGEYTMSMAYLLAWQGPVLEEEDPYGDNMSPEGLAPSVHVQEIRLLPARDFTAIKKAVFLRGGVQSSLYTSIVNSMSRSPYYSADNSSYCYEGEEVPNHDVVIVGWDDQYPRENFQKEPPGDGAFLCVSSWGQDFGDGGYFYVSYYDSNIGGNGLVYTGIEETDNYDRIYQSDLCGWVGQVGYSQERAYGANIYQAEETEELAAVGFYATGEDTSYKLYVARHFKTQADLESRKLVAQGRLEWGGFYTIALKEPEPLEAGERFAIILEVETPSAVHPLVVEYQADEITAEVDVTDGEGYISYNGQLWESLEDRYQCNLCLKGYTRVRKDRL